MLKNNGPGGCCCCPAGTGYVCVTVRNCDGTYAVGDTITWTGPGGFSDTCTTNSVGHCCVHVTALGTYTATDGAYSGTVYVNDPCQNYSTSFCKGGGTVCVHVRGLCGSLGSEVDVIFEQLGSDVATVTTVSGKACACLPHALTAATARVDTPPSRFGTGSVSIPGRFIACNRYDPTVNQLTINLPAAASYSYLPCCDCNIPAPEHLYVTDPETGHTVTLTATSTGTSAYGEWTGTDTYSHPGCVDATIGTICPAATIAMTYNFSAVVAGPSRLCAISICAYFPEYRSGPSGPEYPNCTWPQFYNGDGTFNYSLSRRCQTIILATDVCPPTFSGHFDGHTLLFCSGSNSPQTYTITE